MRTLLRISTIYIKFLALVSSTLPYIITTQFSWFLKDRSNQHLMLIFSFWLFLNICLWAAERSKIVVELCALCFYLAGLWHVRIPKDEHARTDQARRRGEVCVAQLDRNNYLWIFSSVVQPKRKVKDI